MFHIPSKVRHAAAAGGFLLLGMAGAAVIGAVEASAATACPALPSPALGQALKNIDTSLGCNNSSGAALNPATGRIALTLPSAFPVPLTHAFLFDVFAVAPNGPYYNGSYTATFTNCLGGTATPGGYNSSGGGALSLWTTSSPGGSMACDYSVAYAGAPSGFTTLVNVAQFYPNPVLVAPIAVAYSPVVQTFVPPIVPEVPLAALLPVAGVVGAVIFLGLVRRRTRTRPHVVIQ